MLEPSELVDEVPHALPGTLKFEYLSKQNSTK